MIKGLETESRGSGAVAGDVKREMREQSASEKLKIAHRRQGSPLREQLQILNEAQMQCQSVVS